MEGVWSEIMGAVRTSGEAPGAAARPEHRPLRVLVNLWPETSESRKEGKRRRGSGFKLALGQMRHVTEACPEFLNPGQTLKFRNATIAIALKP